MLALILLLILLLLLFGGLGFAVNGLWFIALVAIIVIAVCVGAGRW